MPKCDAVHGGREVRLSDQKTEGDEQWLFAAGAGYARVCGPPESDAVLG